MIKRQSIGQLNLYKKMFAENREFVRLARVLNVEIAKDNSSYNVFCETVDDAREFFATYSFNSAVQGQVLKNELWVVLFLDGDINQGLLVTKLHNLDDKFHPKAGGGNTVLTCPPGGKKIHISNNPTAILNENAVLGQALRAWLIRLCDQVRSLADDVESIKNKLNAHITKYNTHVHIASGPGAPTAPTVSVDTPSAVTTAPEKTAVGTLKSDAELDKLLSDLCFIQERDKNTPKSS